MDTYPAIQVDKRSTVKPVPGIKLDISSAGTIRGINLYNNDVADLQIDHPLISETEKDEILNFYETHKITEFQYDHPGTTDSYACFFVTKPSVTWETNQGYTVVSTLKGRLM